MGRVPKDVAHCVYIAYGVGTGNVLYVGITNHGPRRLRQHEDSPWWPEVRRLDIEHYRNREGAEFREQLLIETLRPTYNVHHNTGQPGMFTPPLDRSAVITPHERQRKRGKDTRLADQGSEHARRAAKAPRRARQQPGVA